MRTVRIVVITEGATEREVGKTLWRRQVLSNEAKPIPPEWGSVIGSREGYEQVIRSLREGNPIAHRVRSKSEVRVLLVFDQENAPSPDARKTQIECDLRNGDSRGFWQGISFRPTRGSSNLFEYRRGRLHMVLHISDAAVGSITNRDFDGYILRLLQGTHKLPIASQLAPSGQDEQALLNKAEQEITELMKHNGFPWKRNKSWLYAYITAFQFRQSHVWFAKRVVEVAPEEALRDVFASLIAAWNLLIQGDNR